MLVGKKVLVSKEILKMLVPLPSQFKLKPIPSCVQPNVGSPIPTTMQPIHVSADYVNDSSINHGSLANLNSDGGGDSPISHSNDAGTVKTLNLNLFFYYISTLQLQL